MTFDLTSYINNQNELVNRYLESVIPDNMDDQRIVAAMKYSLMAGGKRLRPVLCLAAAEAVGGLTSDALPAAAALEMIHTYSLIHDDLPAMDDDELRRGKPTCHMAFDEATAILAGDALLTLAFQMLSSVEISSSSRASGWLQVIRTIAGAAGYGGMIQGQMLDISSEGRPLSISELESMHHLKTGALITASLRCGAIIGGAGDEQLELLERYGKNIGLAFQVADDILNVEGDPKLMGKAVGTDRLREKSTYPSILGLSESKELAKNLVRKALQAIENFDKKSDALRAIANYVIERKR
jgi:geranylgeranyl diphosphate synthase type II